MNFEQTIPKGKNLCKFDHPHSHNNQLHLALDILKHRLENDYLQNNRQGNNLNTYQLNYQKNKNGSSYILIRKSL